MWFGGDNTCKTACGVVPIIRSMCYSIKDIGNSQVVGAEADNLYSVLHIQPGASRWTVSFDGCLFPFGYGLCNLNVKDINKTINNFSPGPCNFCPFQFSQKLKIDNWKNDPKYRF